ncbi:hypothetical protein GCM10023193_73110 [Planotetraspora kaengkrachanensis]
MDPEAVSLSLEALPADAPAVLTYAATAQKSASAMVEAVLSELESAAVSLYPAWLPEAEGIAPGGAGAAAVRVLALEMASASRHFGPFVADLAQDSLRGGSTGRTRFPPEVRAAGLARVLAAAFDSRQVALLVDVPEGLSSRDEDVLVAGCEWLAHRGPMGVWLTGAPLIAADRVETVTVRLPAEMAAIACDLPQATAPPAVIAHTPAGPLRPVGGGPAIRYPAVTGRPHPASEAEQALEAALSSRDWAAGRVWNHNHQTHPLAEVIRPDLMWRRERCVVEIDGPEHRGAFRYEADRRRDVQLQLDGYAVLRFTNDQIASDLETVVRQLERFVTSRRVGTFEGSHHD